MVSSFSFGSGEPIVKGGRYDKLLPYFGKDAASIGFAFTVDQLMSALSRQKIEIPVDYRNTLIVYEETVKKNAIEKAAALRAAGNAVELILRDPAKTDADYQAYKERNQIADLIFMGEDR